MIMMVNVYSGLHKSYKWYMKIAFHMIEEAVLNAYILYKQQPGKRLQHYQFVVAVANAMARQGRDDQAAQQNGPDWLIGRHWLELIPATEKKICTNQEMRSVCTGKEKRITLPV
eukprot:scpid106923/ scgid0826/ 